MVGWLDPVLRIVSRRLARGLAARAARATDALQALGGRPSARRPRVGGPTAQLPMFEEPASAPGGPKLGDAPASLAEGAVPLPSIDEVIRDLATKQARLSQYIETCVEKGVDVAELSRLFALHGTNASRLGRLLRDRLVLSGDAGDLVSEGIALALDELEKDLGGSSDRA